MTPRPGFPHRDISWLFGLIAVQADLAAIKALPTAELPAPPDESHAFAWPGSGFSFLSWSPAEPKFPRWISEKLKATVAYVWSADTAGWIGYAVFKDGIEEEAFEFGANFEEEAEEAGEEMHLPTLEMRRDGWDVFEVKNGQDFRFRSKTFQATKRDLFKGFRFIDARFQALGIPIPPDFPEDQERISWPAP